MRQRREFDVPEEDGGYIGSQQGGGLTKSVCGTRDAVHNWESELQYFCGEDLVA